MTPAKNDSEVRELAGKRAVVTGGSRGIGAAIVRQLLDAGAEVLTTARSKTSTVPEGAAFVEADVRTRAGAEAVAGAAQEALGGVDILVNNAEAGAGPGQHRPSAGTRRPARRHRQRGAVPRIGPGELADREEPHRGRW